MPTVSIMILEIGCNTHNVTTAIITGKRFNPAQQYHFTNQFAGCKIPIATVVSNENLHSNIHIKMEYDLCLKLSQCLPIYPASSKYKKHLV